MAYLDEEPGHCHSRKYFWLAVTACIIDPIFFTFLTVKISGWFISVTFISIIDGLGPVREDILLADLMLPPASPAEKGRSLGSSIAFVILIIYFGFFFHL